MSRLRIGTLGLACLLVVAASSQLVRADEVLIKNESPERILVACYASRQIDMANFSPPAIDGFHIVQPGQTLRLASSWRIPKAWLCIYDGDAYYVPTGFPRFDIGSKQVYRVSYGSIDGTHNDPRWQVATPTQLGGNPRTFPVNPRDIVEDLDGERPSEIPGGPRIGLLNEDVQTFTSVVKKTRHAPFFQPRFGGEATKVFVYRGR